MAAVTDKTKTAPKTDAGVTGQQSKKQAAEIAFVTSLNAKNPNGVFVVPIFDEEGKNTGKNWKQTKNPKYGQVQVMSVEVGAYNEFIGMAPVNTNYAWATLPVETCAAMTAGQLLQGRIFRYDLTLEEGKVLGVTLTPYDYKYSSRQNRMECNGGTLNAVPGQVDENGEVIFSIKNWSQDGRADRIIPTRNASVTGNAQAGILNKGAQNAATGAGIRII